MRPRLSLVTILAFVLAAISLAVTAARLLPGKTDSHRVVHAALRPSLASYLGVYEPGEQRYQTIADFATMINRQPNLVESFGGWAVPFPTAFAQTLHQRGVTPLIQIDPTDASVAGIASGFYDDYLRLYAENVVDFGHPVVIGFGQEMNATWYSWGYGHVPPPTFVAAWRRVVTIFREEGADNVTWLWTIQANEPGTGPVGDWWPGDRYVTWIGIDNFYTRPADTFTTVFGSTINEVRKFAPTKPVLLSETAVGPGPDQASKILDLFRGMNEYKALGLVWFDVSQHAGINHQDWRIEDNRLAEIAFRYGVRNDLSLPASP
jgi:mannan endo-1,4-beta-mannosidase